MWLENFEIRRSFGALVDFEIRRFRRPILVDLLTFEVDLQIATLV